MADAVDHPSHYNSLGAVCSNCSQPIECIDVVRMMTFSVGNVVKYLWRAGLKDTAPSLEDHKKALFYLQDETTRLEKAERDAQLEKKDGIDPAIKADQVANLAAGMNYAKNKYAAGFPVALLKEVTAKQEAYLAAADSFKNIEYVSLRVQNDLDGDRTFSFTAGTTVGTAAAKVAEAYGYVSRRKFTFTFVGDYYEVADLDAKLSDVVRVTAGKATLVEWYDE